MPAASTYGSEEAAKAVFKQLLMDSNIRADDSWDAAMVRIIKDPRYAALPSLSKKKSVFADFVVQRAKAEREERRAKEQAARQAIAAAVKEALEKGTLAADARARDVERVLADDPRWRGAVESGVLDARGREGAASDAVAEAATAAREQRKAARDAAIASLRSALDKAPGVTHETPWRAAMEALGELQGALWVSVLSKAERLEAFAEWVREGERAAAEAAALAREAQRRSERNARKEFSALLWQCVSDGRLTARTTWKDFVARVAHEPAYIAVNGNISGSRPRELFEDVLDEQCDTLSADAAAVTAALGSSVDAVIETVSVEAVSSMLQSAGGRAAGVNPANLAIILSDLRTSKQEKAEKASRKARKTTDDFVAMLRAKPLPVGAPWEAVRPEIVKDPAFAALDDEAMRKQLYNAHAAVLLASGAEPGELMALTKSHHRSHHRDRKRRRSRSERRDKKSRRRRTPSSSSSSSSSSGSESEGSESDSRKRRHKRR